MRLFLEADPEEYEGKRAPLIKALVEEFRPLDPELCDAISKALPHKEPALKFKVLRQLHDRTAKQYRETLDSMVTAIGAVLDRGVQKSEVTHDQVRAELQKARAPEALAKQEEAEESGGEPDDPDYDAETGEPIIDPGTGLSPSETEADATEGGDGDSDDDEETEKGGQVSQDDDLSGIEGEEVVSVADSLEKSLGGPFIGPKGGKWADAQHTVSWRAVSGGISKLKEWAKGHGGKLKSHKTDPSKVVVKVPAGKADQLHQLKTTFDIKDSIKMGSNYAILAVPTKALSKTLEIASVQKKDKAPGSVTQSPKKPPKKKKPPAVPKNLTKPEGELPGYASNIPWKKPETVEQATEWCAGHGVTATFPDLPTAVEVTKALSESHPMVLSHVQFVGTGSDMKEWAKAHPEKAEVAKTQAKHKMDLTKNSPLGGGAAAVAHPITAKPYTESVIIVKDSYWNEKKAKEAKAKAGGFTVSNSLGDTVRHELGHVEGFVMRHLSPEKGGNSMWEIWKAHCVPMLKKNKKQLKADISQYGTTNPHEAWAELAVLRRRGTSVPAWIQEALNAMKVDSSDWGDL